MPAMQVSPPVHFLAHMPQLLPSVCKFAQAPAQFTCGSVHMTAHTPAAQVSPVAHILAAIWQAPAALHVHRLSVSLAAHAGALQVVPTASRAQPPVPSQPFEHASSLQLPVGSCPPAPTGLQVPSEPSTLHAMQAPLHAVAQQRPWAQIPAPAQSSFRLQMDPTGRLPHDPLLSHTLPVTHCASFWQDVEQRLPLQPRKGAHERGADAWQDPFAHTPTPVSLLATPSQRAARHAVPLP